MWETVSRNWKHYEGAFDTVGKKHMLHYLPNFIVVLSTMSVIMSTLGNFFFGFDQNEASNRTRSYVMPAYIPFDNIKQSVYVTIVFQQFIFMWIITATSSALNSVLIILVSVQSDTCDKIIHCRTLYNQ